MPGPPYVQLPLPATVQYSTVTQRGPGLVWALSGPAVPSSKSGVELDPKLGLGYRFGLKELRTKVGCLAPSSCRLAEGGPKCTLHYRGRHEAPMVKDDQVGPAASA